MAYLYVLSGPEKGRSFRLREGENYIGRTIDNDIRIEDKTLSRKHARIISKEGRFFITDLKSQNRTFFDSVYLEPGSEVELKAGIPVALGTTIVTVSLSETDDGQMTSFSETVKLSRADIEKASQMTERRNETEEKKLQASILLVTTKRSVGVINRDAIPIESAVLICGSPPQVAQAKFSVFWIRSASKSHWVRSPWMRSSLRLSSTLEVDWFAPMPVPLKSSLSLVFPDRGRSSGSRTSPTIFNTWPAFP